MTKTLVLRSKFNSSKLIKQNYLILIISFLFVFGVLIGSFSINVSDNDTFYGLKEYFLDYIEFLNESKFKNVYLNVSFMFSLLILINYILGACLIGDFINIFMLIFFSFGIGSISGFLYNFYSIKGVGFFALTIFPGLFLFCIVYLISFKQSFSFSKNLFKLSIKESEVSVDFKGYSIKFLIHIILIFLIALVFSFFTYTFTPMFDLI